MTVHTVAIEFKVVRALRARMNAATERGVHRLVTEH